MDRSQYTRISTILAPFSGYDSGAIPSHILEKAKMRGIAVDNAISGYLNTGGIWDLEPEYHGYIDSMKLYWEREDKVHEVQPRLYCDTHRITGQMDLIAETKKGLKLIDWKCTSKVNPLWIAQASAYFYLCKYNGYFIKEIEFVRLDKSGKYPEVKSFELDEDMFFKFFDIYKICFSDGKHMEIE